MKDYLLSLHDLSHRSPGRESRSCLQPGIVVGWGL